MRCTQLEWLCSNLPSLEEANFSFEFICILSCVLFYLGLFFSLSLFFLSRPIEEKIMSHCFLLLLAKGSCCIILKKVQVKTSLYGQLLHLFSVKWLMNFFLFQFYYYCLKKDNAIQVSFNPNCFGISFTTIHSKRTMQFK